MKRRAGIAIAEWPDGSRRMKCPRCEAPADIIIGYERPAEKGALISATVVAHCIAECGEPPAVLTGCILDRNAGTIEIPEKPANAEDARWWPRKPGEPRVMTQELIRAEAAKHPHAIRPEGDGRRA